MTKKNALGRGLGALIDGVEKEVLERKVEANLNIPVDSIDGNPFQPRTNFDEQALEELAISIRKLGIVQPLTVRETESRRYQLISGERRLRAARLAGLTHVPAYIRTADDQAMLELALVENIQREDLDAIEIAISFQRLTEECRLTQEQLSERVGKQRSTIANYLRLLRLPAEIQ
ncbi:MAG TPA: ParB/RepB/Spo0J family partition protein, partial [Bacteroidales bacterium]|nr:ParB/RepB/Spo0J family partition protein [Bacteroidales bacterium]